MESYSSMVLMKSNQNPIRFNIIYKKKVEGSCCKIKPPFSSLDFVSIVKQKYQDDIQKYIDSQFLPELFVMDEALILTTMRFLNSNSEQLIPIYVPTSGNEKLPILYRLPVFNFSRHSDLII